MLDDDLEAPDDLLAVDFEAEPDDLLAVDFEPELAPDDLLAVVFEPEDLPADEPVPALLAVDFEAVFDVLLEPDFAADDFAPPDDLLVEADFAAGFAEDVLLPDEAARVGADFFVVVDFDELLVDFFVAIFFSLKCVRTNFTKTGLKQTYVKIFTRLVRACQEIFFFIGVFCEKNY